MGVNALYALLHDVIPVLILDALLNMTIELIHYFHLTIQSTNYSSTSLAICSIQQLQATLQTHQ